MASSVTVRRRTSARIPTRRGAFDLHYYENSVDEKEHLALVVGSVSEGEDVLVRIHSECFTGDVLGSLRCDCGDQLERSMRRIAEEGRGVLIYLRQEGRGIGLLDKLRAYNLQDIGYDTVEANLLLGHEPDERDYAIAAEVIRDLELGSVRLLTNNPAKIENLTGHGIPITERVPLEPVVHPLNESYLATKADRMRHVLTVASAERDGAAAEVASNGAPGDWKPFPDGEGEEDASARPYVTLAYAQSLDGSITTDRGRPLALSGPESLTMTHRLRSQHQAILVGIGTVLADDPQLTVRRVPGAHPRPIVADSRLRFPTDARLLETEAPDPWILTTEQADSEREAVLEQAGVEVIRVPANEHDRVDLKVGLECLRQRGIASLMIEGGSRIITSVLRERLPDHLVLTIASTMIGGLSAVEDLLGEELGSLARLEEPRYQWCGDDLVVRGDITW